MVMVSGARSECIQHLHLREDVRTCRKPLHKRALGGFYLWLFCAEVFLTQSMAVGRTGWRGVLQARLLLYVPRGARVCADACVRVQACPMMSMMSIWQGRPAR